MRKVFLKLDGIKGDRRRAGHEDEIEISNLYWGNTQAAHNFAAGSRSSHKDLTLIKRRDQASAELLAATMNQQIFHGRLTLEDYSAAGKPVRSIVFELQSVSVNAVTRIGNGEIVNLRCENIKLMSSSAGKTAGKRVEGKNYSGQVVKNMKRKFVILSKLFAAVIFCLTTAAAQFTIKIPKIKVDKPDKEQSKIKETTETTNTTNTTTGKTNSKNTDSKLVYAPQRPTSVPVFLKNSVYVQAKTVDRYWKMPKESNFSSWVPLIRFTQYYNEEKTLNYTVEYFNPDGSPWYSEQLESSGRNADRTVLYQSPSPYGNGVMDSKTTNGTGVYSFKITNSETKELLFQGKFKVGKVSRAYSAQDKNKFDFYVEHDWLMPFAVMGFHHSLDEVGGMSPEISVWIKGQVEASELEARVFYKGQQVASTKDAGGATSVEDRYSDYAPPFAPDKIWKRWEFNWGNFLFDNNGTFNRENFPNAFYADKNPGEYTVKIYRTGAQIRELSFTIGADGRYNVPAYSNQIPLPYYRIILPVKVIGTAEKWDASAWKTDAFYGNPLTGFAGQ